MAILKMFSFDYSTDLGNMGLESSQSVGNAGISGTARTGPGGLILWSVAYYGGGWFRIPLGVNATTAWIQGAIYLDSVPTVDNTIVTATEGVSLGHISLVIDGVTRGLKIYRGAQLLASSVEVGLMANARSWYFFELYIELHDTTGRVIAKWNGTPQIDFTGDTNNGGSYISYFAFSVMSGVSSYDDFIVGDGSGTVNTLPTGDSRVEYLVPNGVGAKTQFTPSAGVNWGNVDETGIPVDTDYNASAVTGAVDLFPVSDLSGNGLIHAVQPVLRVRKDDAGYRMIRPAFYKPLGAGDTPRLYGGTPQTVGDNFAYNRQILEFSPDTGVAWTTDELAGMNFGYGVAGGGWIGVDAWIGEYTP